MSYDLRTDTYTQEVLSALLSHPDLRRTYTLLRNIELDLRSARCGTTTDERVIAGLEYSFRWWEERLRKQAIAEGIVKEGQAWRRGMADVGVEVVREMRAMRGP
ncbi:MAG: hypothetical protein Q9202_003004 [Teloschistes flavicans]